MGRLKNPYRAVEKMAMAHKSIRFRCDKIFDIVVSARTQLKTPNTRSARARNTATQLSLGR